MVAEARAAGVERLVTVGTDAPRSAEAVARRARAIRAWCGPRSGLHPHDASHGLDGLVDPAAPSDARTVGRPVGECGLDYHYDHSPRPVQRDVFAAQIALAHERDLALVIHTREAWDDTFAVLDAEGVPAAHGVPLLHRRARRGAARASTGAATSRSAGIVTFETADDVRAAAAMCPLDRLLVETDSPYLAPVPHRGRPNRPALVPLVGAAVAEAMGVAVDAVAAATWANAERVYGLG